VTGVVLHLDTRATAQRLIGDRFDEVLLATGVMPRDPRIAGQDTPGVMGYIDAILRRKPIGERVAIVGAGGIGFDVAEFLVHDNAQPSPALDGTAWMREWGVADPASVRGGVVPAAPSPAARQVTLLQRKAGKLGAGLGKTTGWIHRTALKVKSVDMLAGVNYERIGPHAGALGLFVTFGSERSDGTVIPCDSIVLCAGQEPQRELQAPLAAAGVRLHLIGGAFESGELDAKRAIDQGTRLAASL